jgi:hypothetical protein
MDVRLLYRITAQIEATLESLRPMIPSIDAEYDIGLSHVLSGPLLAEYVEPGNEDHRDKRYTPFWVNEHRKSVVFTYLVYKDDFGYVIEF